ncbi:MULTISPECIES: hypothetical protein [Paenibacillus]|uniref:Uncharacterized protein n=1 Tax=Paenibacillus campinasensis TaxID=66347 RepID=A0A268EZD5_9BACL|nr:hypothetical protein [Paenibacillus campinasensis]PAD78485.1 hypothetical protein CHH67_06915 [Paenibacillus campinasensis]
MFKNPLKLSLLMIGIFIIGVVATQTFKDGIDVSGFIRLVEWATLYVLPWIFLYWFVRYVKMKK